jgi:hypothetical protein
MDQYKTSEDLDIYEFDYRNSRHLQDACDVGQPVLFDLDYITPNFFRDLSIANIAKYGKENFKRTILTCCTCKWQLKYEELKIQMENNVLVREDTYNGIVNVRINKVPKDLKEYYKNKL